MKIVENVSEFLSRASDIYGRISADRFSEEMYANLLELGMESPIEHMFWIACHVLCEANFEKVDPEPYEHNGEIKIGHGVFIQPQARIGKYRVDFLISQNMGSKGKTPSPIVVELDGHDFHDKDKNQRAYEKARDRFLVKENYRVLHFTGSEVVSDPFKIAFEVLYMLGVYDWTGISADEYDPSNPAKCE